MRIEFDFAFAGEEIAGVHFIDTDNTQSMQTIAGLNNGTIALVGSGWEEPTKHPAYPYQTRLEAVNAELKRLGVTV